MSLKSTIEQRLRQLPAFAHGTVSFSIDTGSGSLEAELTSIDTIGCSFLSMTLVSDRLKSRTLDELKDISQGLATRVNYLLEPVRPIEIDNDACVVQLRSMPPQKDDDGTRYYEILVQQGKISLQRFQKAPHFSRTPISALVTREVFCRLADDLCQVGANS